MSDIHHDNQVWAQPTINSSFLIPNSSLTTEDKHMVDLNYRDGVVTAKLYGEIDHHIAPQMRGEIDARCESCRPARLVLDFGRVGFMDSSGIGLIMGRYRMISLLGGKLEVVNIPQNLRKIFVLSGLENLGVMK